MRFQSDEQKRAVISKLNPGPTKVMAPKVQRRPRKRPKRMANPQDWRTEATLNPEAARRDLAARDYVDAYDRGYRSAEKFAKAHIGEATGFYVPEHGLADLLDDMIGLGFVVSEMDMAQAAHHDRLYFQDRVTYPDRVQSMRADDAEGVIRLAERIRDLRRKA